ncbi:hypothetical protein PAHAL_5G463000 [Panicum hallii]|uniref:Uncharacterized protein n=1 Tax=Panicum hallii TaxID=206008 RepID=A0A2T8INK1_9POAL|nr:hypothetical protein PAHAL_5G463000 [Panicum hallii]
MYFSFLPCVLYICSLPLAPGGLPLRSAFILGLILMGYASCVHRRCLLNISFVCCCLRS